MDTALAKVYIKKGEARALKAGGLWIYNNEIDRIEGKFENGGMVQVANLADMGTRYVDMVVGNRKSLDGKSDLIQKYVDCTMEACEALHKDPEMAADLLVEFLQESGM